LTIADGADERATVRGCKSDPDTVGEYRQGSAWKQSEPMITRLRSKLVEA
jgi:hypothetical protein